MSLVDCNDELASQLGERMSMDEFQERYSDILQDMTSNALYEQGVDPDNASNDEWDEEYDKQKDILIEQKMLLVVD